MKLRTDYHIHPDYSIDASPAKIKDYCRQAVRKNLQEICFTSHLEIDPVRDPFDNFVNLDGKKHPTKDFRWLDSYFKEIEDAQKDFYAEGLTVRSGIEIGYDVGLENKIEYIINTYPFDFVLGAIHCLDHIAISSSHEHHRYFSNRTIDEVRDEYFYILKNAVDSRLFNCLAHIDLYKRYGIDYYGNEILSIHRGTIEPILAEMASNGIGIEINTSGLRKKTQDFHPSSEIVSLASQAGIDIFTVGSDAHNIYDLGSYIDEALILLDNFGLQNHRFYRGKPIV